MDGRQRSPSAESFRTVLRTFRVVTGCSRGISDGYGQGGLNRRKAEAETNRKLWILVLFGPTIAEHGQEEEKGSIQG